MGIIKDMFSPNKIMELTELYERIQLYEKLGNKLETKMKNQNKLEEVKKI